jgi:hypothetical protein
MVAITTDSHWEFDIPPEPSPIGELRECLRICIRMHECILSGMQAGRAAYLMRRIYRLRQRKAIEDLSTEAYELLVEQPYVVVDGYVICFSPIDDDGTREGQMVLTRSLVL